MLKLNFSIEKPLPISINSELLTTLNSDPNWIAQLKIDEHRSFIIIEGKEVTVLGWRGNVHHRMQLDEPSPINLVLDGGIIKTTIFKTRPMIYVFDVLTVNDERVHLKYKDRLDLLTKHKPKGFVQPQTIMRPAEEFKAISVQKSKYVEQLSKELNITLKEAYAICEGLVLKNLNGVLTFPKNKSKSTNQLKLKLPGR